MATRCLRLQGYGGAADGREAYGARGDCSRFSILRQRLKSASKLVALHTLRAAVHPGEPSPPACRFAKGT